MNIRDSYIHGADGRGVVKSLFFATAADVQANNALHVNDLVFLLADTLGTQVPLTIPTLNLNTTGYAGKVLTVKKENNVNYYLTFVDSNNTTADAESVYTDAGIYYNPSTDTLTVGAISGPSIVIGGTTLYLNNSQNTLNLDTVISNTSTNNTIPSSKAVWDAILTGMKANDAMIFMGFLDGGADLAHTIYTTGADAGYTYKVRTAGYINGEYYQVNDTFICTVDGTVAATSSNVSTVKANWGVVEGNGDYLDIHGGTMYGTLSWDGTTALPTVNTASSILVVDNDVTKQISATDLIANMPHDHNRLKVNTITEENFDKALWSGFYNVTKSATNSTIPSATNHGNVAIHAAWDNGVNKAGFDLLINDIVTSSLHFRPRTGGGPGNWKTLLDSVNYTTYTDSRYVSNVSVSGNKLRITKNGSNTDLTVPYATLASKILMSNKLTMNFWEGTNNYIGFYSLRGTAEGCPTGYRYGYLQNYAYANGDNVWSALIYLTVADYGTEIFTRGYNQNQLSWTPWKKFWHELNDGSGSGLDADLLDGLHATAFLRAGINLDSVLKTLEVDTWTTITAINSLEAGTYAIQISSGTLYASGIFAACSGTDLIIDEIPLHVSDTVGTWRPYARISGNNLQMTTNETTGTARTYDIKIIKLI